MRAESAQPFLHRNSKKSNDKKACYGITLHLKDALKIVVGRVRNRAQVSIISHQKKLVMKKQEMLRQMFSTFHYESQLNSHVATDNAEK